MSSVKPGTPKAKPVGLSHIDLDNIGERFDAGTWDGRDLAALFLEINRLNNLVADVRRVLVNGGAL